MTKICYLVTVCVCISCSFTVFSYPVEAEDRPLRVGVIQSLSGIAAEYGKSTVQALTLAQEELTHSGANIELLIEDDQSNSKNSVRAYQKLKAQGVDAVIGATWDFLSNPVIPLAGQDKVILLNTSTYPEALNLSQGKGYAFSNCVTVEAAAHKFAEYVHQKNLHTVLFLYANNTWGETQLKAYQAAIKLSGVTVLDTISSTNYDENDWQTVLPRIKRLRPEVTVLLLNKSDIEIVLRRSNEIGLKTNFVGSGNGVSAFQTTTMKTLYEGLCEIQTTRSPTHKDFFTTMYRSRFQTEPLYYTDTSYDGLFLLYKAFSEATRSGKPFIETFRAVEHTGIAGRYKLESASERSFGVYRAEMVCINHGEIRKIGDN